MYVVDYLSSRRVWFQTFLHQPASSAARLAKCAHIPGRSVAKSVVVQAGESFLLTVLPVTSRVNLDLLATALGVVRGEVRLATAEQVEQIFHDCEAGTIPPFGRLYGMKTAVDPSLVDAGMIVFRTNARHQGLRMAFRDYEKLEQPMRVAFAESICPGPVRPVSEPTRRAV